MSSLEPGPGTGDRDRGKANFPDPFPQPEAGELLCFAVALRRYCNFFPPCLIALRTFIRIALAVAPVFL